MNEKQESKMPGMNVSTADAPRLRPRQGTMHSPFESYGQMRSPHERPQGMYWVRIFAWALIGTYFLRSSVAIVSGVGGYLGLVCYAALVVAAAFLLTTKIRFSSLISLFLVAGTGASLFVAEDFEHALVRWGGWIVLCFAVGPLADGKTVRAFRSTCFSATKSLLHFGAILSALWWILRLPNLGRGVFTGLFVHSMVLGPLAALAAVLSFGVAVRTRSFVWKAIFLVEFAACLAAGSRGAFAACLAGCCTVLIVRLRAGIVGILLLGIAVPLAGLLVWQIAEDALSTAGREDIAKRYSRGYSMASRESHWKARWEEFVSSPFTGVGFASVAKNSYGTSADSSENGGVEPGSSYLAVLSMTGILGAAFLLLLSGSIFLSLAPHWSSLAMQFKLETCGLGAVWAVHLFTEGYIFAVGSLLCLLFWNWVGQLQDVGSGHSREIAGPPLSRHFFAS